MKDCFQGVIRMTVEQASGNYNYMYEFRIDKSWHPCHLLNISDDKSHGMMYLKGNRQ